MNVLFEAAEDLFIMKCFAGRTRDWLDAESIVIRRTSLDDEYIIAQLTELCDLKESPDILDRAIRILKEKS